MSAPRPAPHTPPAPRSPPAGSAPPGGTGGQRPWPAPPTGPAGRRRRLWRGQRGQQDGQGQGQSVMMTGRAWFLGSDLAGVGTAMITHKGRDRAPIRPSPARHPRHARDFADSLTSNLSTGAGSYHADLIVDFLGQPAPGGNCNKV